MTALETKSGAVIFFLFTFDVSSGVCNDAGSCRDSNCTNCGT